jgi:hypothetical protein
VIPDICSAKTGVSLNILKNELENRQFHRALSSQQRGHPTLFQKSINISQYYHILNKSETEILFNSLEDIFYQIFEFELENRSIRRRFTMVSKDEDS